MTKESSYCALGASARSGTGKGKQMQEHTCHAIECEVPVPPKMLMCLRHWRMVPKRLQNEVWAEYRPGQEVDKKPSRAYLAVMFRAIKAVADKEATPSLTLLNPRLF